MVIFPNHSVLLTSNELMIELAEADLVTRIRMHFGAVTIAAIQEAHLNSSLPGRLDCKDVQLFRLNAFSHTGSPFRKLANYFWVTLLTPIALLQGRIAYIFCPGYCAMIASLWSILLNRPYGLYVRGTWLSANGNTSWIWRYIFKHSSFIIATGEAFRRRLSNFNKRVENEVPLTKIVDTSLRSKPLQRQPELRKLLFVGRLTESKGVIDLIRAVALLGKEFSLNVDLLVAGGGPPHEQSAAQTIADECRVRQQISFLGHIADVEKMKMYYQQADAFVFPTYYKEGFPRVLYEAMMCALPIITTSMPGTDGFLVDSNNCLICKPKDPLDIARCVSLLANNNGLALRLGNQAHHDAAHVFAGFKHASHADQLIWLTEHTISPE